MNARTKVSPTGAVEIPQDMRDRLAWAPGTPLELVETSDGITLRRREVSSPFRRTSLADLETLPPAGPPQSTVAISRLSDEDLRRLIR